MITAEITELMVKSGDLKACQKILEYAKDLLQKANIHMNETQWLSFVSHLSAMVYRSIHKEPIDPLDRDLFNEVSSESIELAAKVCLMLKNLHEDEKYLLSIHFETAKMNA